MKKQLGVLGLALMFVGFNTNAQVTMKDGDGKVYGTILTGSTYWIDQNLSTSKYANGDAIANVDDNTAWSLLTTGAWSFYDKSSGNGSTYGKLYNWYAVDDSRGVCPTGWRVPTNTDWNNLGKTLGGDSLAGGKLKQTGTTFWSAPNTAATNQIGFNAMPSGYRGNGGAYGSLTGNAYFWVRESYNGTDAVGRNILYNSKALVTEHNNKLNGFAIRCVKDYTAGLNDQSLNAWNISINSLNATLTLNLIPELTEKVVIFDLNGAKVLELNTEKNTSLVVSTEAFHQGIYLVQLLSKNGEVLGFQKIGIQK